jgi:acyl dehydratase
MTSTVELPAPPRLGPLYRSAAVAALRRGAAGDTLPDQTILVRDIAVDREHLAEYDRVCGFRLADTLPATYPHVLAFPLAVRLMTGPGFPLPLIGLVHVNNRIEVHRPVTADEPLDIRVHAQNLRPHPRGRQVDLVAEATVGGETVWRGLSTYLRRESGGDGERRADAERPPVGIARWRVTRRTGTDYAEVSGDHNPIHTSRIGARLFGFPGPIAHGMWAKARCLAALEGRLPERYTVDVAFKLPVPLPSTVAFGAVAAGDGWQLDLRAAKSGRPHLAGTVDSSSRAATPVA